MDFEIRNNSSEILEAVKLEEAHRLKGRLKIFLGMAPGSGTTYTMLEEAQVLKKEQLNVVVGIVNAHGCKETELLLKDFANIPLKSLIDQGQVKKEFDGDAVIRNFPGTVLIDDLAHCNALGSKHENRWQDVQEILDHGINVYTTLNVQNIESLKETIENITEVIVKETVPDKIIERASAVQLVDLTPDELIERVREGKVYPKEELKDVLSNFYQKDKLTALREIALRYVADKIDVDLRRMTPTKEGKIEWKTRDKFLVTIDHSPQMQRLIRTARRLAIKANAPWLALYVNTGKTLDKVDSEQLVKNMALVRDLEAEMVTIDDPDVVEGIKRIVYQRGVTQVILGNSPKNPVLSFLQGPSLLDRLAQECKDVDIHVIRQEGDVIFHDHKWYSFSWFQQSKFTEYLYIVFIISLFAAVSKLALSFLDYRVTEVLFLSGIACLSFYFNRGPFLLATALSGLIWYYFFISPGSLREVALLFLFTSLALLVGLLVSKMHMQRELLMKKEKTAFALEEMIQHLGSNLTTHDILAYIQQNLPKVLEGTYRFALKGSEERPFLDESAFLMLDDKEKEAASWAFEHGKEAGWSTETLSSSENLYIPLKGLNEVIGLFIYRPSSKHYLSFEERNLLYSITDQLASYIERSYAKEKEKQHENLQQMEIIHKSVLDRFYKVFEDPILKIRSAIDGLKPTVSNNDLSKIKEIDSSLSIFINMLEGISAMAKLSEGMVPLQKSSHDLKEVVEECCENIKKVSKGHVINIYVPHPLPQISFDYYLIHILLQNVLLYVLKYAPEGSQIDIDITKSAEFIHLAVTAITLCKWNGSMPLGLTVAKTIAEIHHGSLNAENFSDKGIKFTLSLPVASSPG